MTFWITLPCILLHNIFYLSTKPYLHYLLHCDQSFIPSLCASHHLAGVTFRTTSSANNLCCSGTCNSNSFTNKLISFNPSYLGGSHNFVPIHCKDRVMCAHRLVETSSFVVNALYLPLNLMQMNRYFSN
jgi:hypothetical protein